MAYTKRSENQCPACGSKVNYRYGRAWTGKRRLQCLMCGRQFTVGAKRAEVMNRPDCPVCREPMHLYKREAGLVRFRCSDYPACKTFKKIDRLEEPEPGGFRLLIPA
ncbi:MAG TPA: topoisomerase DNA-binding C4 zinc finger domain-containing protein [Nitrospiria bacterium]|nr:topoisomerase DNA-binding C4 zinc finger domain-containing protein [Nitrospiria bacterium]